MAEKDILEKILMSYGDVFADCENALAYGGKQRIRAEDLHPAPTESFYGGREKMHNQFADVSAFLVENGIIKMQFLIGNETELRRRQVLRKASYQGGAYRTQLEMKQPVYPVIGMVVDWTRKSTGIPLSLHKLLQEGGEISGEDLERVDDVKLEVYHMRSLSKEVRSRFTSDMGFVVDYLNEGNFDNRRGQRIVHVEALCGMMEALTGDDRFTGQAKELLKRQEKGEEVYMCEYIDLLEARGEARGIAKGESIGLAKGESIGLAKGESIGIAKGEKIGKELGENQLAALLSRLYSLEREEDARMAVQDKDARMRFYKEFCMI